MTDEITYVFIRAFRWLDMQQSISYEGLPGIGKVYRALRNPNDNSYQVVIRDNPPESLLVLRSLTNSDELEGYTSEIVEISLNNILDLDLKTDALENISKWIESGNVDLAESLKPKQEADLVPVIASLNRALDSMAEQRKVVDEAADILGHLYAINSNQFEILMEIAEELIELNLTEMDENGSPSNLTRSLELGERGLAYNIGKSLECIQLYSGNNRRNNEDPQDLLYAKIALIREAERRKLNELDNEE